MPEEKVTPSSYPIYRTVEDIKNGTNRLSKEDLLLPGVQVAVMSMQGWAWATLNKDDHGQLFAESEYWFYPLSYDKEAQCYTCSASFNKMCIKVVADKEKKDATK